MKCMIAVIYFFITFFYSAQALEIVSPDQPSDQTMAALTSAIPTPTPAVPAPITTITPTPTLPASLLTTPTIPVTAAPAVEATQEIMPAAPVESEKQKEAEQKMAQEADKVEEAEKKALEKMGIDTIDIEEGGNWLLKRKALEDTVDIIEQINRLFTKILETRMDYKIKRNQLDSEYDLFVASIGFDLGDVDELLDTLLIQIERERQLEGDLSASERGLFEEINQKKNEINQLKEDLKKLHDLETNLNDVLMALENQINIANEHQNQAWKNFQLIKKILSDEKAEELYYSTEGLYKSLQEIYTYLTARLPQYFNDQIEAVRQQMNKIKATVKSLQEKGIDLKKEAEKIETAELEREKQRLAQQEKAEIEAAVKKAQEEKKQKNWWYRLINSIKGFFATIMTPINYIISTVKGWFGYKPVPSAPAAVITGTEPKPKSTP